MHWYGLRSRPYGFGHTPPDATESKVIDSAQALELFPGAGSNVRYGAVGYDSPLKKRQYEAFELQPLSNGLTPQLVSTLIDADLKRIKERSKRVRRNFGRESEQAKAVDRELRAIRTACWDLEDAILDALKNKCLCVEAVLQQSGLSTDCFNTMFRDLSKAVHKEIEANSPSLLTAHQSEVYAHGL